MLKMEHCSNRWKLCKVDFRRRMDALGKKGKSESMTALGACSLRKRPADGCKLQTSLSRTDIPRLCCLKFTNRIACANKYHFCGLKIDGLKTCSITSDAKASSDGSQLHIRLAGPCVGLNINGHKTSSTRQLQKKKRSQVPF